MTYLFVATTTPALLGVYDEAGNLLQEHALSKPASEALPELFASLVGDFKPTRLVYTNTPGSFMALKIAYCFFACAALALDCELYGISAFAFMKIVKANNLTAFVPEPTRLMPLSALRQDFNEYFNEAGDFKPPVVRLPKQLAQIEDSFVQDAKPQYCLDAY